MEAEGPPELVASRSCRNDKKLVVFIIEQHMRLTDSSSPVITFWSNIKDNYHGLWFYNNIERYLSHHLSSYVNTAILKKYKLEQLNILIAYSTSGSKQLMDGYLKRAHIAYASEEDLYCLYNIWHAAEVNATHFASDASILPMFDRARVRRFGSTKPFPHKVPNLGSCYSHVECKDSKKFGRYLNARQIFNRGNTVLNEVPFVSLLTHQCWVRCHHCLIYAPLVLVPCQSCSLVMFCSVTCRDRAHEEYHSMECAIMTILLGQCTPIEFLAVRLTIRVYKMFPGTSDELDAYIRTLSADINAKEYSTPNAKADYRKVYKLATNRIHVSRQRLTYNGLRAVSLVKMLVREHKLPAGFVAPLSELTVRHLHILRANALVLHCSAENPAKDVYGSEIRKPYALVLLTTGSMFNHSCNANVEYRLSPDGGIEFVTNRYIRKGAQMFINYRIDPTDTRYEFECYCHKCASERARHKPSSTTGCALKREEPS